MQLILTPPPKVMAILKEISFNCGTIRMTDTSKVSRLLVITVTLSSWCFDLNKHKNVLGMMNEQN